MTTADITGACQCGGVHFSARQSPLFRAICHCGICQRFNQASFGDVTVFRAGAVEAPRADTVAYQHHRWPPIVRRGRCKQCDKPAIEWLDAWLRLAIVPSANLQTAKQLPLASLHIFYDCRVADVEDDLPKYRGYLASQWAFMRRVLGARRRG